MGDTEQILLPFRLRTVRTGVQATFGVLAGLVVYGIVAPPGTIDALPYGILLGLTGLGGGVIALLPWRRLFTSGHGLLVMYAWSVADILIITALIPVTGGIDSEFFWLYCLTAFFMASSYRPRSQVILVGLTAGAYLAALVLTGERLAPAPLVHRFAVIGVLTFMTSFVSRELLDRVRAHAAAQRDSERRATLLSAVTTAARTMSDLDSEQVLEGVVAAAMDLGFDAAMLCVFAADRRTYTVPHSRGVPAVYSDVVHGAREGISAGVMSSGRTVVVSNYAARPDAVPALAREGFVTGLATPVWVNGEAAAVLASGNRRDIPIGDDVVEAFELLAAQAGRALENARRFEQQHETVTRLAELDELKRDFLSNVSHELRTPLTVVEGLAATLDDHWDRLTEERKRDMLGRVSANALALDEVITTLLDFSRLEAGGITPDRAPVDLGALVGSTVERLSSLFAKHDLVAAVSDGLVVEADVRLLDRVVENLLSNAAKYTPEGTRIEVVARDVGGEIEVSVSDDGPGIRPEDLAHLGERFYRGGDSDRRSTRGTGLGLAFCVEVLELHGTKLEVASEVGAGSRFTFRLPRRPSERLRMAAAEERPA